MLMCDSATPVVPELGAVDLEDLRRKTVSLLWLRPSSGLRSFSPRPQGKLETHRVGKLAANALPWRYFAAFRRKLLRPQPNQKRPYPPRRQKNNQIQVRPVERRVCEEYLAAKRNIGLAEREILTLVYKQYFKCPPY
jgi:hypothetical protein